MIRTIEIERGCVYYRGKRLGDMSVSLSNHFPFPDKGKVKVVIEENENGSYQLSPDDDFDLLYTLLKDGYYEGCVCQKAFDNLFFVPDENKRYNITVKKVK